MLTYMDAFSRFRTLNTLSQLETLMGSYTQLEMFEKAQLCMGYSCRLPLKSVGTDRDN
jgi:hypothetical protein